MGEIEAVVSGEVTLLTAKGEISLAEVLRILQEFYAGKPTKYIIWDLAETSLSNFRPADIEQIACFASSKSHLRVGGKTAIVAPRDLEFGFGRMFGAIADHSIAHLEVATFRKLSDAANWIGVNELPGRELS